MTWKRQLVIYRRLYNRLKPFLEFLRSLFVAVSAAGVVIFSFIHLSVVVFDVGFNEFFPLNKQVDRVLGITLPLLLVCMSVRLVRHLLDKVAWKLRIYEILLLVLVLALYRVYFVGLHKEYTDPGNTYLVYKLILYAGLLIHFFIEFSRIALGFTRRTFNPALLFVISFILFIFFGTCMLLLPNSSVNGLSFVDALFLSASAVCVTGLSVLDISVELTKFGHIVMMLLIQIGGLGIMTFAGLIGHVFSGGSSFMHQLTMKDMVSSGQLGSVIQTIRSIITVTFLFELAGAIFIYFSVPADLFEDQPDRILYTAFHAVSAFCNAGFSLHTNSLFESVVRFNYAYHSIILILLVLGGLGFPIVLNLYIYIKYKLRQLWAWIIREEYERFYPKLISFNSKLGLYTTLILIIAGFVALIYFEWDHGLQAHPTFFGKVISALFGSATARTAGFNTIDTTILGMPMIMVYLLLMWIGASPGGTGGGIKTTTAATVFLSTVSTIKGKDRTEVFNTEISNDSIRKAYAILLLSILVIGISVLLLTVHEPEIPFMALVFECISAFTTTGLSMGITGDLSDISRVVLSITMFIGRISVLNFIIAFVKQSAALRYHYPKEEIIF